VFIGADADTRWLPEQIARDARGYVLTGDKVVSAGAGRILAIRIFWKRAFPASSRAVTCA
jgi:hypothetical protein